MSTERTCFTGSIPEIQGSARSDAGDGSSKEGPAPLGQHTMRPASLTLIVWLGLISAASFG